MSRPLELIHEGNGVVLHRYTAFLLLIRDEFVFAQAKLTGALAREEIGSRSEIGPIYLGCSEKIQRTDVSTGNGVIRLGEVSRVQERYARSHGQAAGSAHYDEPGCCFLSEGLDLPLRDRDDGIRIVLRWSVRADDRLCAIDRRRDCPRVRQVIQPDRYVSSMLRDRGQIAHERHDLMTACYELIQDAATGLSGVSIQGDFQGGLLGLMHGSNETMRHATACTDIVVAYISRYLSSSVPIHMLESVTLDQLRIFVAAADEGSFSAAGRKIRRAQSVVSQTLANLEGQCGVKLFDRSRRRPVLTAQGQVLLAHARTVVGDVDRLKAHAKLLAGGLESEVSIAVDVLFPMDALTAAVGAFHAEFPLTPLRLYVETLGAVMQAVLDGRCAVGVSTDLANVPRVFSREPLLKVPLIHVTSPRHPLAKYDRPIPTSELAKHIQLVLTDRSSLSAGQELGVLSPRTWRLADLAAKHAFLRAGLGWGGMPEESVRSDLLRGSLVKIIVEDAPPAGFVVTMRAVYRTDAPPGIAARWLIERLKKAAGATSIKDVLRRKSTGGKRVDR